MADQKAPTPAEIVIMAGGGVALIGSFLKFQGVEDFGSSSWASGNFPVVTLMTLFALISAVVVALRFAGVSLPDRVLGFSWPQIHLILGFFAALYALAFLVVKFGGADRKIGFWLVLIGCLGSLVGAFLLQKERGTVGGGGAPGPGI